MDSDSLDKESTEWKNLLLQNPEVQIFFDRYRKFSVENFCNRYADFKKASLRYGSTYRESKERRETEDIDLAMEQIEMIQQKKLFDLQCLWRAGMIDIPQIRSVCEFQMWEYGILAPFWSLFLKPRLNGMQNSFPDWMKCRRNSISCRITKIISKTIRMTTRVPNLLNGTISTI